MSCPEHNTNATPRPASRPVLAVLIVAALASSWWGIGRQGVMTWDEGVYFDEARFVVQAIHAVRAHTSIAAATTGFVPRMGRPGNTSLNVVAMAVLGLHPWVPAGLAGLLGALAIAGTYLLGRRLFGEDVGRVAALLLLVSPYFLQYRRAGLPEAAGTVVAVFVLLRLVGLREHEERRPWVNSLTLGLLLGAGLAINMRLGVLLPLAGLFRLCWLQGERSLPRLVGHGVAMVAGVGAVALAFEAPYHALSLFLPGAPPVESYFQQLVRFAQTQQGMGRPPLHLAYLAPFVFLAYLDLPALALAMYGVCAGRAWRDRSAALLVACLLAQLLSLGFVSPFARYLSWTLPALMILAAWGVVRLTEALRPRLGWAPAVVLALLVLAHTGWRGGPILAARGQMAAAAAFLQARPGAQVATSNASLLLAYSVPAEPLPLAVPEARDLLLRLMSRGPTFVVLDRQRFMDGATIMPPERYDRSAGAIIAHVGRPAWQTQQFRRLFVPYAFEHNFDILATLRSVRGRTQGEKLAIYTADEALTVLEQR